MSDISLILPAECKNYESALGPSVKPLLDRLFREEILQGRFSLATTKPLRVHAVGAVPKKECEVPRPITDCSRPFSCSLNCFIEPEKFSLQSIDDVVHLSTPGCFYSVVDVESADRFVPVFPAHRTLQSIKWDFADEKQQYYVDDFLFFGLSDAPVIFHRFSISIARIMRKINFVVVSYLDDFLLIAPTKQTCSQAQSYLVSLLIRLGFGVKWSKEQGVHECSFLVCY